MNLEAGTDATDVNTTQQASRSRRRHEARRYAFACTACKARKVKCSGDQPICNACRKSGTTCKWQNVSTDKQLQHAVDRIQQLEQSLAEATTGDPPTERSGTEQGGATISPHSAREQPTPAATAGSSHWFQVGRGEDGTVVYSGPTSRFHVEPLDQDIGEEPWTQTSTFQRPQTIETSRKTAYSDALASQYKLLNAICANTIPASFHFKRLQIDSDIGMSLLEIYWTWLQPLHNCVYRICFLMDMTFAGRYYSDFLLLCILSLAARHLSEYDETFNGAQKGEQYLEQAKALLLQELAATKPRISTIQGLLLLGGRQCAMGKSSEGWLYTGMAVRMLVDIGLHLHIDDHDLMRLESLTPVEVEARKRLYNSAYIWDKTISLALGRQPSLTVPPYATEDILDHNDDLQMWQPVLAPEIGEHFVPVPSNNTATFCAHSQLHMITTDMLALFSEVPDRPLSAEIKSFKARFVSWYDNLPGQIRIDIPSSLAQSPPPHIVSLNVLYHALIVLLYRPSLDASDPFIRSSASEICTLHSKCILDIVGVYERTFPYRLMTYQLSYCVFTAATVEVWAMKNTEGSAANGALERLTTAMRVLYYETKHTPGLSGSLETIRRQLTTPKPVAKGMDYSGFATQNAHPPRDDIANEEIAQQTRNLQQDAGIDAVPIGSGDAAEGSEFGLSMSSNRRIEPSQNVYGFDTGAGFHPNAFPWSFADSLEPHWGRPWSEFTF